MNSHKNFPDPLAKKELKKLKPYGLEFAKAIESQWGSLDDSTSLLFKRNNIFETNRDYANGNQNTNIYKSMLTSLDPMGDGGALVNIDFTPVPVLPKFVRIVVNKILGRKPSPNIEAVDPLSSSEKNKEKKQREALIKMKARLMAIQQQAGGNMGVDLTNVPDTLEESEIFDGLNVKTVAETAAQIGTDITLVWSDFYDSIFTRCVNDLVALGMAVSRRTNDPNYGIRPIYVNPNSFVCSLTEDPGFNDITYAGHIDSISIQELKRLAGEEFTEQEYETISRDVKNIGSGTALSTLSSSSNSLEYGYDNDIIKVLFFEFISVDSMHFEEKENKHGNENFFFEGFEAKQRKKESNSVFSRKPKSMQVETVYKGVYILGTQYLFGYGEATNTPKNIHDITKAKTSYSAVATNIRRMMPKSMVNSCIGFADMLQITHIKLQQAVAKAKPDGLIIDIEGLENVQLGKAGELEPLALHDIYEQTGVFYYRSKNPEGGFQNPPIRTIDNHIRNINELITLYNHYLGMIRDTTGINEMMDGTTPKGDTLVGVQQNAISAGNNAIYDMTDSAMLLFKKVCEDIVKCLQIIPVDSVIMNVYRNAIGEENMDVLSSFSGLFMYNFGVTVVKEMEDKDKQLLEEKLRIALSNKEIDLEDDMAIRELKDISQAQKLLVLRRKKRMAKQQEMAQQNMQMQSQADMQKLQAQQQIAMQELQAVAQIDIQKLQVAAELKANFAAIEHQFKMEVEMLKAKASLGFKEDDKEFKEKIEVLKEDRKDDRVKKQSAEQSKLISQRNGDRGELDDPSSITQPENLFSGALKI